MQDSELIDQKMIITRDAAEAQGLTYFFTGKPCRRGHIDYRFVSSGGCKRCVNRNSGRIARGTNVVTVLHVFSVSPTPEERVEVLKLLQAWSDPALAAVRKLLQERETVTKALDAELRRKAGLS